MLKAVRDIVERAIKASVIDVKLTWVFHHRYPILKKKQLLDTGVIARSLRDKLEGREPITIENFVIDPINGKKSFHNSQKLI